MPSNLDIKTITDMAADRLNWSRQFLMGLLSGLSDDQLTLRAGGKGNHALWIMGHVAASDDGILAVVSGGEMILPDSLHQLCKGGSEPVDDAGAYPSRQELLDAMQTARQAVIQWTQSLDEQSAFAPTPDSFRPFAPNALSTAFSIAAHEMVHAGQLTAIRAVAGLPRMM